jgi:hypothetical protein
MNQKYDTAAAAERIGVVKQTLCNWRQKRRGPAYHKIGSKVYYSEDDLNKFIDSSRIDPNEQGGNYAN